MALEDKDKKGYIDEYNPKLKLLKNIKNFFVSTLVSKTRVKGTLIYLTANFLN